MFFGALATGSSQEDAQAEVEHLLPCYSQASGTGRSRSPDPHRNLFWMFISFMGISIPKPGQENRALRLLIIGVVLLLAFVAAGMFALFRLW